MKLTAICLGRPEVLSGKSYRTGINKMAVNAPMMVDAAGLVEGGTRPGSAGRHFW
nr:MOSC domain-containing protein [Rhizobium sp. Q54]